MDDELLPGNKMMRARDTFGLLNGRRSGDTEGRVGFQPFRRTEDTESDQSSLPELSRVEENALRRSFRSISDVSLDDPEPGKQSSTEKDWAMSEVSGPKRTVNWDEGGLKTTSLMNPIPQLPTEPRELTPDKTLSSGRLFMMNNQGGKLIETSNLGQTTRGVLKGQTAEPYHSQVKQSTIEETSHNIPYNKKDIDKKPFPCCPRAILLGLILAALLAAVIVLLVMVPNNEKPADSGAIVADPVIDTECADVNVNLGDNLHINCIFDTTHKLRTGITNANFSIMYPAGCTGKSCRTVEFTRIRDAADSKKHKWNLRGPKVTCSLIGTYRLSIYNTSISFLLDIDVNVALADPGMTTSIKQRMNATDDGKQSLFDASCSIRGVCSSYKVNFLGFWRDEEITLNHYQSCTSNYTDESGRSITCSGTLPEEELRKYYALQCHINVGDTRKEFKLPECKEKAECQTKFNCTDDSPDYEALEENDCDYLMKKVCFEPGRFIYTVLNQTGNNTYYACKLSWCREKSLVTSETHLEEHQTPGKQICGDTFEDKMTLSTIPVPTTAAATTAVTSAATSAATTAAATTSAATTTTNATSSAPP